MATQAKWLETKSKGITCHYCDLQLGMVKLRLFFFPWSVVPFRHHKSQLRFLELNDLCCWIRPDWSPASSWATQWPLIPSMKATFGWRSSWNNTRNGIPLEILRLFWHLRSPHIQPLLRCICPWEKVGVASHEPWFAQVENMTSMLSMLYPEKKKQMIGSGCQVTEDSPPRQPRSIPHPSPDVGLRIRRSSQYVHPCL